MNTPYGLQIIEDCIHCPLLRERVFCDLPKDALSKLDSISSASTYPRGAVLFVEGQDPRGVFILCNGRVKMYGASATGKSVIFRIAEAGEVIGLPSTLSGKAYEVTAGAREPVQANFIRRDEFMSYLRHHNEAALKVAVMLSTIHYATCQEVRYLGLSTSPAEKLARYLLDQKSAEGDATKRKVTVSLTHEEIANTLGTSRETVSRVLASFKRKHLIETHGATVVLSN